MIFRAQYCGWVVTAFVRSAAHILGGSLGFCRGQPEAAEHQKLARYLPSRMSKSTAATEQKQLQSRWCWWLRGLLGKMFKVLQANAFLFLSFFLSFSATQVHNKPICGQNLIRCEDALHAHFNASHLAAAAAVVRAALSRAPRRRAPRDMHGVDFLRQPWVAMGPEELHREQQLPGYVSCSALDVLGECWFC